MVVLVLAQFRHLIYVFFILANSIYRASQSDVNQLLGQWSRKFTTFQFIDSCSPVFLWSKKSISDMFSVNQLFKRLLPQSCSAAVDESYNLFKSVSKRLKKYTCRTCNIGNSSGAPITTEPVKSPKRSSLEACLVKLGLLPVLLIYQCLCLRGTSVVSKVYVTSVVASETVS